MGVEAGGVAAGLPLRTSSLTSALAPCPPARYLRDLKEEHLARELDRALALAPPRGDLRPDSPRPVLLAPQAVDVLLVEISLGKGLGAVTQPVGFLECLRDPS